jgi:hypothetical protein
LGFAAAKAQASATCGPAGIAVYHPGRLILLLLLL